MFENIIFGLMVAIALGAGIITCIYEVGGSFRKSESRQQEPETEQSKTEEL